MHPAIPVEAAAERLEEEVSADELRVLVVAPTGRDASLICDVLRQTRLEPEVCSFDSLEEEMQRGVGAVVIAEEALVKANIDRLVWLSRRQPPWSDFPLILMTVPGEVTRATVRSGRLRAQLGNVLLLERPFRPETLVSSVQGALRARRRQYELRGHLRRQAQSEQALRQSEKLAVAGRLAATIAHEINNPLEAVMNLLWLVQSDPAVPEAARSRLKEADEELVRVAHLTRQTLGFYRPNSAARELRIGDLIAGVLTVFGSQLRNKDIHVHKQIDEDCSVLGKEGELRQLFANLVSNSIDALPPGGTLRLRASQCTFRGKRFVRVSVADNGPGIAAAHRKKVFEPFFSTKQDHGTGLGLWVAKDIVEKHHGWIGLRTRLAEPTGTVFAVFLPGCLEDKHAGKPPA